MGDDLVPARTGPESAGLVAMDFGRPDGHLHHADAKPVPAAAREEQARPGCHRVSLPGVIPRYPGGFSRGIRGTSHGGRAARLPTLDPHQP
jgi:hypothetical protein